MTLTAGGTAPSPAAAKRAMDAYVPWVVVIVALALVGYFDLQAKVPLLDEYARRWTLERLANGHGLALWGKSPGLVELAVAAPLALAHVPPEFWRWTLLLYLAMTAFFSWRIASLLGADRFWASVAAATLVCAPSFLSLTTGFMNEPALLGFLMAGIWYGLCWIRDGRGIFMCVVVIGLATLQRQQGATIAAVTCLGVVVSWRERPRTRGDLIGLVGVAAAVAAALVIPFLFRPLPTPGPLDSVVPTGSQLYFYASSAVLDTFEFAAMLALLTLPFAVAILKRPTGKAGLRTGWRALLIVLAVGAVLVDGANAEQGLILPPGYLHSGGLGFLTVLGSPRLFPGWFVIVLNLAIAIWAVTLVTWRPQMWSARGLGFPAWLLLLFAAGQLVPLFTVPRVYDRYYFSVVAPLIPLLAVLATRAPARRLTSHAWAIAILVIGVGIFAVGEDNYVQWQLARDKAAQLAYRTYPPFEVNAGFEEAAQHIYIPLIENPGKGLPLDVSTHPRVRLYLASPNDPRPGYGYGSIVAGKVVLDFNDPYPRAAPDLLYP